MLGEIKEQTDLEGGEYNFQTITMLWLILEISITKALEILKIN